MAAMIAAVHGDHHAVEGHVAALEEDELRPALVALAIGCGEMFRTWMDDDQDAADLALLVRAHVVQLLAGGGEG